MNSEPKVFASLSSGLLARKGAARPAMRPQGFGQVGANGLDDLGWNDMGFEAPKPAATPDRDEEHDAFGEEIQPAPLRNPIAALTPPQISLATSPVHDQHAELADAFGVADGDESDDGEDYPDDTAEPWSPEAEESVERAPKVQALSPVVARAPLVAPAIAAPVAPVTPAAAAVVAPAAVRARRPRAANGANGKAAFTLRLDGERHLKLRLACAVGGRSAQQIVTEALDQLLASMPELASMADQAPKKRAGL